jgi:hypothetical protein
MNFNRPLLTKSQIEKYITICELTWGGSPIDIDWAIETNIYQEMEAKLILSGVVKEQPKIRVRRIKTF